MAGDNLKPLWEAAAKASLYILLAVLVYLAKDTVLTLRQIQQDILNIKIKLAVMESASVGEDKVRVMIKEELERYVH